MTFQDYCAYFQNILNTGMAQQPAPYDNPDYLEYTKLNWARMNRWLTTGKLTSEMLDVVNKINKPQQWLIITEPWCGDAAHNVPFLDMIARTNPLITASYELRDAPPFTINQYLTNGTKSIPKLIIRDQQGNDLATWGPRPAGCQVVFTKLKEENAPFEQIKLEIQNWYNANKGVDLQEELTSILASTL